MLATACQGSWPTHSFLNMASESAAIWVPVNHTGCFAAAMAQNSGPRFRFEKPCDLFSHFQEARSSRMRYRLGRFLQLLGLCIVPSGIAGNVLYPQTVTEGVMLAILAFGALVFYVGHSIQVAP